MSDSKSFEEIEIEAEKMAKKRTLCVDVKTTIFAQTIETKDFLTVLDPSGENNREGIVASSSNDPASTEGSAASCSKEANLLPEKVDRRRKITVLTEKQAHDPAHWTMDRLKEFVATYHLQAQLDSIQQRENRKIVKQDYLYVVRQFKKEHRMTLRAKRARS